MKPHIWRENEQRSYKLLLRMLHFVDNHKFNFEE